MNKEREPSKVLAISAAKKCGESGVVMCLHCMGVWRDGPGHMSPVVSVASSESQRDSRFYRAVLERFKGLSHVTVEVRPLQAAA
jgi:hypothetical protein